MNTMYGKHNTIKTNNIKDQRSTMMGGNSGTKEEDVEGRMRDKCDTERLNTNIIDC